MVLSIDSQTSTVGFYWYPQEFRMASTQRSEILLLSLANVDFFDESYSLLIERLRNSVHLKRAKTAKGFMQYLATNSPKVILVTDEGLTFAENSAVLDQVVSYVRNGGFVIVGLHFPNFAEFEYIDKFFNEGFGLPWKSGKYQSDTFQFNPSCSLPTGVASNSFPAQYMMKVLHVKNAEPHEKLFVPSPDVVIESVDFSPGYLDQTQAAVVGTRVGDGYIVYAGDVNPGEESSDVILRLCGL